MGMTRLQGAVVSLKINYLAEDTKTCFVGELYCLQGENFLGG
jgi:hypothetical protein